MNDQKFDINKLRVASPCTVSWDAMAGDDRTRHCEQCSLSVFNVSALSTAEVEGLVLKREGRLCIRMYRRADGTVLTRDCPVGLRAVRKRVASFAGATLASVLGLFSITFGQRDPDKPIDIPGSDVVRTVNRNRISTLKGVVTDEYGAVVSGARVVISLGSHTFAATSDADGIYGFPKLTKGKYRLTVSVGGFRKYELKALLVKENEQLELNIKLRSKEFEMGVYVDEADFELSGGNFVFRQKMIDGLPY